MTLDFGPMLFVSQYNGIKSNRMGKDLFETIQFGNFSSSTARSRKDGTLNKFDLSFKGHILTS